MVKYLTAKEVLKLDNVSALTASCYPRGGGFYIYLTSHELEIRLSTYNDRKRPKLYRTIAAVYLEIQRIGISYFTCFVDQEEHYDEVED